MGKLFSYRNRPMHHGPFPLEKLPRREGPVSFDRIAPMTGLSFRRPDDPLSIVNAMQEYQAMLLDGGAGPLDIEAAYDGMVCDVE